MPSDSDRDPSHRRPGSSEQRRHRHESQGGLTDPERRRRRDSRANADRKRDASHDPDTRRRRGHRATDSQGALLPRNAPPPPRHHPRHAQHRGETDSEWESSPRKARDPRTPSRRNSNGDRGSGSRGTGSGSGRLSLDALQKLDKANAKKAGWGAGDYDEEYLKEVRRKEKQLEKERVKAEREKNRREKDEMRRQMKRDGERKAVESEDLAREEKARMRREERKRGTESNRERGATDDERRRADKTKKGGDVRSGYTGDERDDKRKKYEERYTSTDREERRERRRAEKLERAEQRKRRVVSGPLAEEGGIDDDESQYMMEKRGGGGGGSNSSQYTEEEFAKRKKWKRILIGVVSVLIVLAIIIPVAVMMSNKSKDNTSSGGTSASSSSTPSNSNLNGKDRNSVPEADRGGIYDPWSWYDTQDFNVTYTKETVGGLPIIGLNSTWNDDVQANSNVPNLKDSFQYGKMPVRGVNVGGWLNLEPFITPSFFERWGSKEGIVDEWTLLTKLGATKAKDTLEKHYSSFITKQTFADIRAAGMDHVRFPFGYWIVQTYDGDPYLAQVSWRYLLRGIEYCRQNGLRVNLDLHGAPGSQNGWNHSGRQGIIRWLNGTDGDLNAQRTLDIHHKLSVFFAQPRYKNIVTMYGIVNEPRMVDLNTNSVLNWTQKAITQIRADNITAIIVFGDGFMGLDNWQGKLQNIDNLLLDVHQYVIFNIEQLSLKHRDKLNFACAAWTQQSTRSMDKKTGFGPTMCGEWSQADTDCTQYINNVGIGTRWEGTYDTGNKSTSILKPQCPDGKSCTCDPTNTDPSSYSAEYKKWLYQFAIGQMDAFEAGWGWFYWTWETEKATQWSYRRGLAAGILPKDAGKRDWKCPTNGLDGLDQFTGLAENY